METKNVELTEELKSKLKSAGQIGFQVDCTFKYVPKFYRDPKNEIPKSLWPIFTLRSKNGLEIAEAEDKAGYINLETKKYISESGSLRIETLRNGIVDVKNFICEDGSILSCKNKLIDELIKSLPIALQIELQNAINERSQLTSEELLGLE